jgi:hypothetical protein
MEDRFVCLGGLVDTDRYPKQVNFPGKWLKPNFDDYLLAGTPLVTVIPIKRSHMNIKYNVRTLTKKEFIRLDTIRRNQLAKSHFYTKTLREKR